MDYDLILAKHYYKLGLNVTCISNSITENNFYDNNILKAPYHHWKHLKMEKQKEEELLSLDWKNATGMGTIVGYNNLFVLDIDGCTNPHFVDEVLAVLELPRDYEWVVKTGSQSGYHIYFYYYGSSENDMDIAASTFPPNFENMHNFEKIEFLWNTHVVLPNSLHKSGFRYSFLNCNYPQNKPLTIYGDINWSPLMALTDRFLNRTNMINKKIYFDTPLLNQPSNLEHIRLEVVDKTLYFLFDVETDGLISEGNYSAPLQFLQIIHS